MDSILLLGIALALVFNFANGLNDAGNAIATVVATRALSPQRAVLLAAICNFIGPFILTAAVARTIGIGILNTSLLTPTVLVIAITSALALVLLATLTGFPISASHALVGGLIGAGIAAEGLSALILPDAEALRLLLLFALIGASLGAAVFGGFSLFTRIPPRVPILTGAIFGVSITVVALMLSKEAPVSGLLAIVVFIFISPALGFFAAFLFDVVISNLFRHSLQPRMRRIFQPMQDLTAAFQAIGHGSNDGQHAAGVIAALFLSAGLLSTFSVSGWVIAASSAAIALGTLFGGWQVVEKLAKRITRIRPYQGFSAGLAGGGTIWLATLAGIPVSSTHVISGAIIGVGATRGADAVDWGEVKGIVTAWIITIPLGIGVAYLVYWLTRLFTA